MSAEQTLSLTPDQKSDAEAASGQIYADAADEITGQTTGLDVAALLTIFGIIVLFHVLSVGLRTDSPLGAAIKLDSLRKVLTVLLGFLALTVFIGERHLRTPSRLQQTTERSPLRLI